MNWNMAATPTRKNGGYQPKNEQAAKAASQISNEHEGMISKGVEREGEAG